jgi:hypothetical protein
MATRQSFFALTTNAALFFRELPVDGIINYHHGQVVCWSYLRGIRLEGWEN